MGATVRADQGYSSPQEATDWALVEGRRLAGAGHVVGPPWYMPMPVHGTYPLEYTYDGRVWYGEDEGALLNRFYSHLYEAEEDAVTEALENQEHLLSLGYAVGGVGVQAVTFDGRGYYQSTFYFGMTEEVPEPFEEIGKKTPWWVWGVPIVFTVALVGIILVGKSKR